MTERLSEHFTAAELACPTTGQVQLAQRDGRRFIDDLQQLRYAYGRPMVVTSGCRTSEHNEWLRSRGYPASPSSFHLIGNEKWRTDTCAVDIKRPSSRDLHDLIRAATQLGWSVGIAKTFIHLDLRVVYSKTWGEEPVVYVY